MLNIEQLEYAKSGMTQSAGAKAVIQAVDVDILPDENGLELKPHTKTNAALKIGSVTRLSDPYETKCITAWNETAYKRHLGNVSYSLLVRI